MKPAQWIALGCVFAVSLAAFWSVLGPSEPDESQRRPDRVSESVAEASPRVAPSSPEVAPPRAATRALPRVEANEGQPEDPEWDKLSAPDRMRRLEADFAEAVAGLEAGDASLALIAQAEGALSELRAQMYATPAGRERHEGLEGQLAELTDSWVDHRIETQEEPQEDDDAKNAE